MDPDGTAVGDVTFTASANTFASTDVGRSIRYWDDYTTTIFCGWGLIKTYNSATEVVVDVNSLTF